MLFIILPEIHASLRNVTGYVWLEGSKSELEGGYAFTCVSLEENGWKMEEPNGLCLSLIASNFLPFKYEELNTKCRSIELKTRNSLPPCLRVVVLVVQIKGKGKECFFLSLNTKLK